RRYSIGLKKGVECFCRFHFPSLISEDYIMKMQDGWRAQNGVHQIRKPILCEGLGAYIGVRNPAKDSLGRSTTRIATDLYASLSNSLSVLQGGGTAAS